MEETQSKAKAVLAIGITEIMQKYHIKIIKKKIQNAVWEMQKKKSEETGMLLYFHRLNKLE